MPNWVVNKLTIDGPPDDVDRLVNRLKTRREDGFETYDPKNLAFDFNVAVRMPPELATVTSGGCTIDGKQVRNWRVVDGKNVPVDEEALIKKYGHANWYDWAVAYWGTKWNACEVRWKKGRPGHASVEFSTAWSPPEPVIRALAEQWPTLKFRLLYYEGGMGFQGVLEVQSRVTLREESSDYHGSLGG